MNGKFLIPLIALAAPALVVAQDSGKYQCTYRHLVRRVEIFTEPGVSVPCEVHYYKDTEAPGETQVLWSAESDGSYCESQAQAFIAKLEGWGWECGSGAEPAPAPEAMPEVEPEADEEAPVQDDTDVLSPGDPSGS